MKKFIGLVIGILFGFLFDIPIHAHENEMFKHIGEEGTGAQVLVKRCPSLTVLGIDNDNDGEIDQCKGIIYTHELLHKAAFRMTMTQDGNGNAKFGCSCEPVEEGI
jgi:hypothetical protein